MSSNINAILVSDFKIPIDPSNKFGISIHYFEPYNFCQENEYYDYYKTYKWGEEDDYVELTDYMEKLENTFTKKGIPIVLIEVGVIIDEPKEIESIRLYLYSIFSITKEKIGIAACLWDTSNKNYGDYSYYNRETNEWYDEILKNIFSSISRGKYIKSSDYYKKTNTIVKLNENDLDYFYITFIDNKPLKLIINLKVKGSLSILLDNMIIYSQTKDYYLVYLYIDINNAKKQYDGTYFLSLDISKEECNDMINIIIFDYQLIKINNITVEFSEQMNYFDYKEFRSGILNNIE